MYGKELAKKLIDCDKNNQFIMPITEDGRLAMITVDEHKITRVKYIGPHMFRTLMQGETIVLQLMLVPKVLAGKDCWRMVHH
jgi:hypothetical protein